MTNQSEPSTTWSKRIETRYQCILSNDLADWFDRELWRNSEQHSGNAFSVAVTPDELLGEAPESIWPALMPCDFLPILGNGMGDWLCVQFRPDNQTGRIVHWYHGGGDWIPWGDNLAEAILFDHLRERLPGSQRDHAVTVHQTTPLAVAATDRLVRWAVTHVPSGNELLDDAITAAELSTLFLERQLCQAAVRCQLIIASLENPLLENGEQLRTCFSDKHLYEQCLFDNDLVDDTLKKELSRVAGKSWPDIRDAQDWGAVVEHARAVSQSDPGLAWAWELLGYAAERRGDRAGACGHYRRALECSIFTDQSVRLRTHSLNDDAQKFSAFRLKQLGYTPVNPDEQVYFDCLVESPVDERRDRVRELFSARAEQAMNTGQTSAAHDLWVRAGWDLGAEPMKAFADLLERVCESAGKAQRTALSRLAETHRACFRQRYGI